MASDTTPRNPPPSSDKILYPIGFAPFSLENRLNLQNIFVEIQHLLYAEAIFYYGRVLGR